MGTPDVAAETLSTIREASLDPESCFEVSAIVTQPPRRRKKRKSTLEPTPVAALAEGWDIPILTPEKANSAAFLDELEDLKPDLCITAAYGQYLPKRFLATPPLGTVNIHPSLLPRWRGASPVQRSLEQGDNPVGVTLLYTVSAMDAGPILAQTTVPIDQDVTTTTLLPQLFQIGTQLLLHHLPSICNGTQSIDTATVQDEAMAVPAPLIHASEAEFRVWEASARTCHNRLRGFSLWPQAFLWLQVGDRPEPIKVKVLQTRVVEDDDGTDLVRDPTDVVDVGPTKKSGLYVVCGDGSVLELLEVCPATRRPCRARDFYNGYRGEVIRWVRPPED